MSKVYRAIQGQLIRETDKALLLIVHSPKHPEHTRNHWFPLSQIASIHRTYDEDKGIFDVLMVSEWILGTKGLLSASTSTNPVHNISPIPARIDTPIDKPIPTVKAKTEAEKKLDQLKYNRMPYKDDEGYDQNDIPF